MKLVETGTNKIINYLLENRRYNIYVTLLPEGKDINDLTFEMFSQTPIVTYKEWKHIFNFS